MYNRRKEYL